MSSSLSISSDLNSVYISGKRDEDRMFISGNGVLLSVLGNGIVGCELPSKLRTYVSGEIKGRKPFFELDISEKSNNHVLVNYNDDTSAVFVIGITEIDINSPAPGEPFGIKPERINAVGMKLKNNDFEGVSSEKVVFVKTEVEKGATGLSKTLKFYTVDAGLGRRS